MRIKVIARTTDESVYVIREGGPKHGRVYLELEARIPESAFPKTRAGYDSVPLSNNPAFNANLYFATLPGFGLEIENFQKMPVNGEVE